MKHNAGMPRRLGILILFLCLLVSGQGLSRADADARPVLEYFYENYCASCDPAADFVEEFRQLTGGSIYEYQYLAYDISLAYGREKLSEAAQRYGLEQENIALPLVIVDGEVFMGSHQIRLDLPQYGIQRVDGSDSVMYYLYVTACESCAQAQNAIDALPEAIDVTLGDYTFSSPVQILPVDIGKETGLAYALFDAFGVPEEKRLAPLLLAGEKYYQGAEAIERFLYAPIYRGLALRTPRIVEEAPLPALRLGTTALAGLIGGLNPCALSMLLLFLSMLVNTRGNAGKMAAVFLSSKFVVYLLIGTVFLTAFQLWNPTWLPIATKILLTAISAVFIVLNLRDAWMARRGDYGEIRNQLPSGLRQRLQARIQGAFAGKGGLGIALVAGLGAFVAAGEFLCSGQVYLATLLAAIQSGEQTTALVMMLIVYCIAFLTPSIGISVLIVRGRSAFELSEFMRRNMPVVKLITALFFIALLVFVWVT